MITVDQIKWGEYGTNPSNTYEGPYFPGVQKFVLPTNPDEGDRQLAVICAAEGGRYDAVNQYDRGIISVGCIQWIELAAFSVSKMLHEVAESCGSHAVLGPLAPALIKTNSTFKKNKAGQWRFFFIDSDVEVNSTALSQKLFLGCSGLKGKWTPEAREQAKLWTVGVANVFQDRCAQIAQMKFTKSRGRWFFMADATKVLYDGTPDTGWAGAVRASYASFAANLPSTANAMVKHAATTLELVKWSPDWCIAVIKQMTLGPKIKIYRHRYDATRPVLESLWGITLPKTTSDLEKWQPALKPVKEEEVTVQEQPEQPVPGPSVTPEPPVEPEQVEPKLELPKGLDSILGGTPIDKVPDEPKKNPLEFFLWMLKLFIAIFTRKKLDDASEK